MRFRLLEASRDGKGKAARKKTSSKIHDMQKTSQLNNPLLNPAAPLETKQEYVYDVLTKKFNSRNCNLSYSVQDTTKAESKIFEIVNSIFEKGEKNKALFDVFKDLRLKDIPEASYNNVLTTISEINNLKGVNIKSIKDMLLSKSLYTRGPEDFGYTLKILAKIIDPSSRSKYFKGKDVDFKELMNGTDLKDGGIAPKDESTNSIFGVIDAWCRGDSGKQSRSDDNQSSSNSPTYVSFEDVKKDIPEPRAGQRIHIEGDFTFDNHHDPANAAGWRPVKFYKT